MSQKLLIIVLVVLVVIFVITLGIGGCHGGGDTDDAGAVRALKGLQGKRFLEIGDKASTTCDVVNAVTLSVSTQCTVTFEKRRFFNRSTRVVFQANGRVGVRIVPKNGPQQDEALNNECFASAIDHAGGTMILAPIFGAPTITLLREGCPE
jgi:hypothetical protein